jgi:uncharacterized protein involved in outer membrane biogenesis
MKRKWILRSLVVILLVLLIVFVVAAFSLGTILKRGVERIGPTATQVDVKLKTAEVWLFAWRFQLTGFVMGNPPGYKTPSSIEVGNVVVKFEPRTLLSDKLVVDSIKVKAPVITLEGGLSDNNLKKIEKNLDDYVGSSSTAPNSSAPPASPAKPEKKLQVNDFLITGAKLRVNTKLSAGRTITLSIPDIHLSNLGSGPEGITPVEVGQRALHAVLNAATKEVAKNADQLGEKALGGGEGAAKKIGDKLKGLFH